MFLVIDENDEITIGEYEMSSVTEIAVALKKTLSEAAEWRFMVNPQTRWT